MNPKFAQFDKLFGVQTPTPQNGVPNRSAQILQMEKQTQSAQPSQPTGVMGKIGGAIRAVADAPKNIGTAIGTGIADIAKQSGTDIVNDYNPKANPLQTGMALAKDVTNVAVSPLTATIGAITPQPVKDLSSGAVEGIKGATGDFIKGLSPELANSWQTLPPEWKKFVADTAQTAGNVGAIAGATKLPIPTPTNIVEGGIKTGAKIADTASTVAGKAKNVVTSPITTIKNNFSEVPKTSTEKIQEMIAPKNTIKEARLAQAEGRLVKGTEPTKFKSGKPDTVLPSAKVISSAKTIEKHIPNASELTQPELYNALGDKVDEIATNLKPEMQKIQVNKETIKNIDSKWQETKMKQIKEADATEEANIIKQQKQFQERLDRISNEAYIPEQVSNPAIAKQHALEDVNSYIERANQQKNLGMHSQAESFLIKAKQKANETGVLFDESKVNPELLDYTKRTNSINPNIGKIFREPAPIIEKPVIQPTQKFGIDFKALWDERISYDRSIPENVKNANELSPISLQNKKEMWLQNRKILNDAINDNINGLGGTSKQAFSDMNDMYNAQKNLQTTVKIDTKGIPSLTSQFLKKHPAVKTAGKLLIGGGIAGKGFEMVQ